MIAAEGAQVVVLNGAKVAGLAQATADWLKRQGLGVVSVDTADRPDHAQTEIVDDTGKPHTGLWLARTLHVLAVTPGSDPASMIDIKMILGPDWRVPQAGQPQA